MENFIAYNPVRLHFGVGVVDGLGKTVSEYGKKVLLVYGKGSAVKYGYYQKVVGQLETAGIEIVEYSGIKSNPIVEDVEKATLLGINEDVDAVIALGGGSVIDSAKVIALSVASKMEPWLVMTGKQKPTHALPIITVLTIAATGSEMNNIAVVQNVKTKKKLPIRSDLIFPSHSFLDPSFTVSVPRNYTAFGVVDLIAHSLEAFFGAGESSVIDAITIDIIKDAMEWGPKLCDDLNNLDLRAKIMLDATLALNGLTMYGKKSGDWGVHAIGHELSLAYDIPHGASLSIVYPSWMKHFSKKAEVRILKLGKELFDVDSVDITIERFRDFFKKVESPVSLKEVGIDKSKFPEIIYQLNNNSVNGNNYYLSSSDYSDIVMFME